MELETSGWLEPLVEQWAGPLVPDVPFVAEEASFEWLLPEPEPSISPGLQESVHQEWADSLPVWEFEEGDWK